MPRISDSWKSNKSEIKFRGTKLPYMTDYTFMTDTNQQYDHDGLEFSFQQAIGNASDNPEIDASFFSFVAHCALHITERDF